MNKIVNRFLLAGNEFMPKMHLIPAGFKYSACGRFTRNKQRIHKFMQTGDTNYIYKMILIKLVFNMIWLMANTKTWKREHNQIKS